MAPPKTLRKPTIRDIARDTGVSTTTVINVLKGRNSEVSKATATAVRRKATELGYVRNLTAVSLVSRRSHAIALIAVNAYQPATPEQAADINPFYGELILRLELEARKAGYMLSLYGGAEDDYLDFLLQRNVDAAVLVGITRPEIPRAVARQGVPVLMMDCAPQDPHYLYVRTDELRGGEMAATHLLARGCRSLVFLGDTRPPADSVPRLRQQGALRACTRQGVTLRDLRRLTTYEDGVAAAAEIIAMGADGVLAAADNLAAGLVHTLLAKGVRVPDDVAVVGYDNLLIARLLRPMLTTIDQGLGEKVRAIMTLVEGGKPGQSCVIEPRLVVRESA